MKKLNEKRAYTKIKPMKCGKYIGTKENDDTISSKMFQEKYGILEEGIHCSSCILLIPKVKREVVRNIFKIMKLQNPKKKKKALSSLNYCNL